MSVLPRSIAAVAVVGVALAGASPAARADETNRYLFPIGEQEALRANAGIAGSSPGSVFFNPAGLALVQHPQLAVSGTTLMYFRSSTDRLLELDEPVPYRASGFAPIPASLVSTYRLGDYSLATAILVPDYFQLDNRQRYETASARLNLMQSVRRQDLWLGAGIARRLGDFVGVGVSLFGVRRSSISNSFFQIAVPSMPGVVSELTTSETTSIIGLTSVLGVTVDAFPWLTIGVRVEPPFLQISGTASIFQSLLSNDGTMVTLDVLDKDDVSIDQPVPADIGVGFAIKPSPAATIYLDASVQLPKDYTFVDDPEVGPPVEVELRAAPRVSLGADIAVSEKLIVHAGALYNRGALRRLEEDGDAREDFFGGTGGITWKSKRTRTGIGAFVLRSSSRIVPVFGMGDTEPATTTVVGGLLTVAYLL